MFSKGKPLVAATSRAAIKFVSSSNQSQQILRVVACGSRIGQQQQQYHYHRRYVWHSGYLDFAAAEDIATEINALEQRLKGLRVRDAGVISGCTQQSILDAEAELHELRNNYEDVAGEPYEYEEVQQMKTLMDNNNHTGKGDSQQAPKD